MMGFNDGPRAVVVAERIAKYLDLFCVYAVGVYTRNTKKETIVDLDCANDCAALMPGGKLCNFFFC